MTEGLAKAKTGDPIGLPTTLTARRTRMARHIDNSLGDVHEIGYMFAHEYTGEDRTRWKLYVLR